MKKLLAFALIAAVALVGCKTTEKPTVDSSEQTHWVNHIYDETVSWPNGALMWANVHGFDEGPGQTYWIGVDVRSFGFRAADYVVKCKNKSTYDDFLYTAWHDTEKFLSKMREDSRVNCKRGSDVNIEFIFRWSDDDKTFDVHLSTDDYAEEK